MSPSECKQWPFVQNSVSSISLYTWFQCQTYKRMCCQGVAGILIGVFVAENTGIIIRCFQFPLRVCQLLLSPSAQCGCTNTHKSTHTHTPAPHSPRMPACVTQVLLRCNAFENLDDLQHACLTPPLTLLFVLPLLSCPHSQVEKKECLSNSEAISWVGCQVTRCIVGMCCIRLCQCVHRELPGCHCFKRSSQTIPHTCLTPFSSFSLDANTPSRCKGSGGERRQETTDNYSPSPIYTLNFLLMMLLLCI